MPWPVLLKGLVESPFKVNSCLFSVALEIFLYFKGEPEDGGRSLVFLPETKIKMQNF